MSPPMRSVLERWLLGRWFSRRRHDAVDLLLGLPAVLTGWYSRQQRRTIVDVSTRVSKARRADFWRPWVIVVGNLIAGGAGKTPVVLALAEQLKARGFAVGIVCHAYRTRLRGARRVTPESDPAEVGDEAVLLSLQSGLPCASGRDRETALQILLESVAGLDVVLADDGLQHPGLARDFEVAVFDSRGVGNGLLLPAGPLREPVEHLSQMDAVLFNATVRPGQVEHTRMHAFCVEPVAIVTLDEFFALPAMSALPALSTALEAIGQVPPSRIRAIAGIGNPQRFEQTLAGIGLTCPVIALGDHAPIDAAWLGALDADLVLMTAKDAIKLRGVDNPRCRVVLIRARLDPAFIDWLSESIHQRERVAVAR